MSPCTHFVIASSSSSSILRASTRTSTLRFATSQASHGRPVLRRGTRQYATVTEPTATSTSSSSSSSSFRPPPPPPRRSLPSRILRTVGLAVVLIPTGFAMATVPAVPAINELISPPSDAETLSLFQAYDERSAEIDAHIVGHPVAEALRGADGFTESRPFLKLAPAAQAHHLTSGVLGGRGRLWVPPLSFLEQGGRSIAILMYLGADMCGHRGIVHGGLLATLLDEGLARCCFAALPHKVGMTASLTIDYKAPTPADTFVVLRATTTRVEGRKAWVEGRIEELDPPEGQEPRVFATAKGLFIEPKQAATMQMLMPAAAG